MEKLKSITIIFLLAVGLLASAASAKPASVLLQEGLYAEEIEGDLDAAIKIYEQVITQAKDTQRVAAHATYRIGMCYLKKGEKAKAAEQFRNLVSKFPEKKSLVTKARRQLAKLEPIGGLGSAELVSVSQLIKSGKVPAFKTQIYDNTGLDLETGVTALLKDEWPALFDVVWDNDGGGALMIKPRSSVRFLALGAAEKWGDAISMARNTLAVLRTSTARGIFAGQSKFVAVLTSEGNLAVVEIGDYDTEKAMLYWWLEKLPAHSFGPVMEKVINDDGVGEDFMFDLDIGKSFSVSDAKKWGDAPDISEKKSLEDFVMKSGIDLFGETSKKSLMGIDMIAMPIHNERWDMSPEDVIEQVSMCKPGTPVALSADGQLPKTFVFKTGQGGMGILQIIEMQAGKAPRHFKIRYKMLQKESAGRIVFLPDADDVIQQGKVAVVLDLTTGKMLPGNKDKQYFNKLNKGDVAYFDDEGKDLLVCFRGAKITRKTANGKYYDTPDQSHTDNTVHIYIIKKTPAEWTITTKEGDIYELKVLSLDNDQAKIKYRKMPTLEKKTSIDEKLRSAFIACGTLCDSIRNALDDDDFETAEALCKEVEKHIAKGLELTPQSELGPMFESLAVQFKIWHEAIKAKDKEKAIRLGEALNHAGGLISDFVLEEKPDTHK